MAARLTRVFLLPLLCLAAPGRINAQATAPSALPPATSPLPLPLPPSFEAAGTLLPPLSSALSQAQFMTFCVPQWQPFSYCDPAQPSTNYTGYDVELVRAAARDMGLSEGRHYRFTCSRFSAMIDALTAADGECSASTTGITITSERQAAGIKFSYPTLESSLGILVQAQREYSSGWGFTRPFAWDLWLALFLTLLLIPPLIFALEFWSLRRRIHRDDIAPGIAESTWRSALTLMLYDAFTVTSLAARVAVLAFMFLALLVTSTYTANLAAAVTVSSITSKIASVGDLRGKAVGTSPIYMDRLKKYGIQATLLPFERGSDYLAWRDLVASGELSALVRDEPALLWLANRDPQCRVVTLEQTIEPFDYGIAFRVNTSEGLVDEWSRAVLRLQEDGTLQQLRTSWVVDPTTGCHTYAELIRESGAVSFQDLYGLWIVLGVAFGLGGILMIGQRTLRRWRKRGGHWEQRGGSDRGPLPEGRRPLRLVSAVRSYFPHHHNHAKRSHGASTSSSSGGSKRQHDGVYGQRAGARDAAAAVAGHAPAPASPRSPGPAIGDNTVPQCWDVESCGSEGHSSVPPLTLAVASSRQQRQPQRQQQQEADEQQQQQQQQQPVPAGWHGEERSIHRATALTAVDSVYAAGHWKSKLRAGCRSPSTAEQP